MPVLFLCILMLALWIRYESKKNDQVSQCNFESFWEREKQANYTRNQPIDHLPLIQIPLDELPLKPNATGELKELQDTLVALNTQPIIDLSHLTNTELKLTYGTGHFKYLSECDANFLTLMNTLNQLAILCEQTELFEDAITYYEALISYNDENILTYVRLAKLYHSQNQFDKLLHLKQSLEHSVAKNKNTILSKIEPLLLDGSL